MSLSSNRKGIILAGGMGTRLNPLTTAMSKQLLPVYNKPMIYYPLSVLMLANIKDILIISQTKFIPFYKDLLGDGSHLGISIQYASQDKPRGIPDAFIIGEDFIKKDKIALILGDNIFYGSSFSGQLLEAINSKNSSIFCSNVNNRSDFGILEFDKNNNLNKIIEKPTNSLSSLAVTGLYFYNNDVLEIVKNLKPSSRGELEISDINNHYINNKIINVIRLYRGTLWLDTGSFENLFQCSAIIHSIEKNTNVMVGCIEEIAFHKKWITSKNLETIINNGKNTEYFKNLKRIIDFE